MSRGCSQKRSAVFNGSLLSQTCYGFLAALHWIGRLTKTSMSSLALTIITSLLQARLILTPCVRVVKQEEAQALSKQFIPGGLTSLLDAFRFLVPSESEIWGHCSLSYVVKRENQWSLSLLCQPLNGHPCMRTAEPLELLAQHVVEALVLTKWRINPEQMMQQVNVMTGSD